MNEALTTNTKNQTKRMVFQDFNSDIQTSIYNDVTNQEFIFRADIFLVLSTNCVGCSIEEVNKLFQGQLFHKFQGK